jgi:hypothetical protein
MLEITEEESIGPATPTFRAITASYPNLDMNGVAVISCIMGQTVALDTYNDTVDDFTSKLCSPSTAR